MSPQSISTYLGQENEIFLFQVNLNDEDPNLQELLQAGRGGILMEDFVKYSLDMKLLDVQVSETSFVVNLMFGIDFVVVQLFQ